ncbi:alpha/beta fold hydrolase [Ovoidimarina sediminis]|uniref:alpha/beta fold hydrolase n=1 Tax=Ovoidimarina sediminis TaxID=3079856 RepID=UPI002905FC63|nr:alpha/beta hydrolase [Rhodophyticola sp. MJ-SS7]MDU8945029.1 alpha/beta hydrolase [Rhodophyticola sp. MJ-SS7]
MATTSLVIAGLAALGAFGTSLIASKREARAEAAYPPAGRFIEVDGTRIHAVVAGDGPDLVLIHGAFGSTRDFTFDFMGRLSDRYRVIALDRPGLGWSGRADASYARLFADDAESPVEQARILAAAARQLGADQPIVVGHSFGGIVALAWALEHDPAAVVSLAGVAMPWPGELGWLYTVNGTSVGGALVPPLITALVPEDRLRNGIESTFAPQPAPDGYAAHIGPMMPVRRGPFRANARQVNTLRPHVVEMSKRYPTLTLPIEIVHGTADSTVPITVHSGPFSELVASANLVTLDGVGHMPHHVATDEAIAAIERAAARAGLR